MRCNLLTRLTKDVDERLVDTLWEVGVFLRVRLRDDCDLRCTAIRRRRQSSRP